LQPFWCLLTWADSPLPAKEIFTLKIAELRYGSILHHGAAQSRLLVCFAQIEQLLAKTLSHAAKI